MNIKSPLLTYTVEFTVHPSDAIYSFKEQIYGHTINHKKGPVPEEMKLLWAGRQLQATASGDSFRRQLQDGRIFEGFGLGTDSRKALKEEG